MEKVAVNPWQWQEAYGYNQAFILRDYTECLVCSGQTANDEDGHPVFAGDMASQIVQAFSNVEQVFAAADWGLNEIVSIRYYTTDVDLFMQESQSLQGYLASKGCIPAQTLLGVQRLAFPEMMIEIEVLAVR